MCDRAGTGGVFEDEGAFVPNRTEEVSCGCVVVVGFGGETNDDVSADHQGSVWLIEEGSCAGEEVHVFLDVVPAVHEPEDAV